MILKIHWQGILYVGAEEAYRTAIRLDPEDAKAHYSLGNLLEDVEEDYAGAEEA